MLLSVICQAKSLTRRFIVELEQNSDFPNQSFSIKSGWHTLSGTPSGIVDTNGYAWPDLPSDYKRHRLFSYGVKTSLIDSISWQWLYVTNLLVGYELILTAKHSTLFFNTYSWLPLEVVVAAFFLKSYWNPESPFFNPIKRQSDCILTQGDHPFATIVMTFGSGHDQQQYPLSAASDQQTPETNSRPRGPFTSPLNNDYGSGDGGSQQHSHTLDLHCFVYPCHGVCRLRSSSGSREPGECWLNSEESASVGQIAYKTDAAGSHNNDRASCESLPSTTNDFEAINTAFDPEYLLEEDEMFIALNHSETKPTTTESAQLDQSQHHFSGTGRIQATTHSNQKVCDATAIGDDGQPGPYGKVCNSAHALTDLKRNAHSGIKTCNLIVIRENGKPGLCGAVCKSAGALSDHKRRRHSGQQTCDEPLVGEDGQQRPCGKICKNLSVLLSHTNSVHCKPRTCEEILVDKFGQPRPCGKVCKNLQSLSSHKSRYHSGQQTCNVTVVDEDGQRQSCGGIYKNFSSLTDHKRRDHSGQRTCNATEVSEDGQPISCGMVCSSLRTLLKHKKSYHSRQQTCDLIVVGKNGQWLRCGRACKNADALSSHKSKYHTGQKICDLSVVGQDGQQRPCGTVFDNANALSYHKRRHRKRKPVDVDQDHD
ncbi:hypothetical protein [Endozoicomonas sp. 8E]|uniref:hypothetical protein n=1 Tax=Endozoicomonas sp. 8E TaxID=3035692 RepID=UPI0029390B86|nr:hypothetical protein [Endozoicomonas sp. 8E]WOG26958.1 hypothetical protein P6910_20770 [Endozoicomonas sp. 8E]